MIVGAQGYTLRNYMQTERDIRRSLAQVAEMGYTAVQISGIGPIAPEKLRAICDACGLDIVLTHTNPARILDDTEAVISEHQALGCRYVGLGSMPERYRGDRQWIDFFADDYLTPAKKLRDAGLLFMYHNHNFEFERLLDGRTIMDILLERFPADTMGVTLDTYWLQAAGCDICLWIDKLKDRIPCVHLKDMTVSGMEIRMAAVGQGNLNWEAILNTIDRSGGTEYLLVEQDYCYGQSPFVCLKQSYDYLAARGYR